METELILIGAGIYGIILASGFLVLSTVRAKRADVARELVLRMMKTVDDGIRTGAFSQNLNAGDVRMLNKASAGSQKYIAFPFMNDPQWNQEGPETEKAAGTGRKTELLIVGAGGNTDVFPGADKKTELLHPVISDKTEVLRPSNIPSTSNKTELLRPSNGQVTGDNTELLRPSNIPSTSDKTELLRPSNGQVIGDNTELLRPSNGQVTGDNTELLRPSNAPSTSDKTELLRPSNGPGISDNTEVLRPTDSSGIDNTEIL